MKATENKPLHVLYEGEQVGFLVVTERHERKCIGKFVPGGAFDSCRALFEEIAQLDRDSQDASGINYPGWDRWVGAIGELTPRITIPEEATPIEEFALMDGYRVEVTFTRPLNSL